MPPDSSIVAVAPPKQVSGRVHLWRIDLDRYAATTNLADLSAEEESRAAALTRPGAGLRFRAAHHALRGLLGMVLGREGGALVFAAGRFGRPHLAEEGGLHFSLSHSEGVGVIGLGEGPVGVDVEVVRPVPEAAGLAAAHWTSEELVDWGLVAGPDRDEAFLACWTRKEAVAKALGVGLSLPPRQVETAGPEAPRVSLGGVWWPVVSGDLVLGAGVVGAVALADAATVAAADRALPG